MDARRRALLKVIGLTGAMMPFVGCERLISNLTQQLGQSIPESLSLANGPQIDPSFHLLSRAAYGPWPGDLDRVRALGAEKWIEEQLAPDSIDDTACDLRARRFETIWHEPGTCYEYKKPVLREEITRHTLLRAIYSRRQLFEVMVGFWTDHLNINLEKGDCISTAKRTRRRNLATCPTRIMRASYSSCIHSEWMAVTRKRMSTKPLAV